MLQATVCDRLGPAEVDIGLSQIVDALMIADVIVGWHDDQVDALTQGIPWTRQNWSRRITVTAVRGHF